MPVAWLQLLTCHKTMMRMTAQRIARVRTVVWVQSGESADSSESADDDESIDNGKSDLDSSDEAFIMTSSESENELLQPPSTDYQSVCNLLQNSSRFLLLHWSRLIQIHLFPPQMRLKVKIYMHLAHMIFNQKIPLRTLPSWLLVTTYITQDSCAMTVSQNHFTTSASMQ